MQLSFNASVSPRSWLQLFVWLRKCVNAAFQFGSAPPAGTGVSARDGNRRTWFAPDAAVSCLIQGQRLNRVLHGILLHLRPIPQGERVYFEQRFAILELMLLHHFQVFARG